MYSSGTTTSRARAPHDGGKAQITGSQTRSGPRLPTRMNAGTKMPPPPLPVGAASATVMNCHAPYQQDMSVGSLRGKEVQCGKWAWIEQREGGVYREDEDESIMPVDGREERLMQAHGHVLLHSRRRQGLVEALGDGEDVWSDTQRPLENRVDESSRLQPFCSSRLRGWLGKESLSLCV